jgi:Transaldolase/Fructose-6-phosphate aldolase/XFP N-terminal domain
MALTASADIAGLSVSNQPLSLEELRKMNAYWRAANYLSVGQIYLYANPLLRGDATQKRLGRGEVVFAREQKSYVDRNIKALAAPFTVNTMPEATLKALAEHTELGSIMAADGGDCEEVLARFAQASVDVDALATQLQQEGAKSFVKSWNELMSVIASKSDALKQAA